METRVPLRVQRICDVARDVKCFDLTHVDGLDLAPATAGAHIEIQLPNHMVKSYSLLNEPGTRTCYRIAVHRVPTGAGGSQYMHAALKVGDVVLASVPRNNFPLNEAAARSCFIAGGIGITPLLSMIHRLVGLGRSWELHYCAPTASQAPFAEEVSALGAKSGGGVRFYFSREPAGRSLDLAALAQSTSEDTHVYCCGPRRMLEAFEQAMVDSPQRAHVEYFSARSAAAREGGFVLELARSGLTLEVAPGRSILDTVFEAGISVPSSCREGICGTCETRIVSGEADHRDALLSEEERRANQSMMICCSGAKSARLVLDL